MARVAIWSAFALSLLVWMSACSSSRTLLPTAVDATAPHDASPDALAPTDTPSPGDALPPTDMQRPADAQATGDATGVEAGVLRCDERIPTTGTCIAPGCAVAPFSLPTCGDVADERFAFYGPTFCDAELTLVDLVGAWCVPCQQEAAALEARISRAFRGRVRVLTIVAQNVRHEPATAADCRLWHDRYGLSSQMLRDPTDAVSGMFNVRALPFKMIIDRNGRLRWRTDPGTLGYSTDAAVAVVTRLLGDPSLSVSGSFCGTPTPGFACAPYDAAQAVEVGASCTTADIGAYIADCFDPMSSTAEACGAWLTGDRAVSDCGRCLARWNSPTTGPRIDRCEPRHLGGSDPATRATCLAAWSCFDQCRTDLCGEPVCYWESSAGMAPERIACLTRDDLFGATGRCAVAIAAGGAVTGPTLRTCEADATYRAATETCRPDPTRPFASLELFFRGACRDRGVWQRAVNNVPPTLDR